MKKNEHFELDVNDLIIINNRVWKVTGLYMGCTEQENAVGLVTMDLSMPCVPNRNDGKSMSIIKEMYVPFAMIDPRTVYRQVNK